MVSLSFTGSRVGREVPCFIINTSALLRTMAGGCAGAQVFVGGSGGSAAAADSERVMVALRYHTA